MESKPALTTEQMQAKYGKNWDTKPHGGNDTYGSCECDQCAAWLVDFHAWETAPVMQDWQKPLTEYEQAILTSAPITECDYIDVLSNQLSEALEVLKTVAAIHPELLKDPRLQRQPAPGCEHFIKDNRIERLIGNERLTWLSKEQPSVIKHYPSRAQQTLAQLEELQDRNSAQAFESAITASGFSHISTRRQFGGYANSYRSDTSSPTGVLSSGSISFKNRYFEPMLAHHKKTAHHGPQRGDIATSPGYVY